MRLPEQAVKRAVAKKRKAARDDGGPSKRPRPRSPPRTPTPPPQDDRPQAAQGAVPAVDLDTPPEEQRIETTQPPAGPTAPRGRLTWPEDEPAPGDVQAAGEHASAADRTEAASSAPGAVPEAGRPSEAAEGSRSGAIPSRPSIMNQGRRAEQLMAQVCRPEILRELHGQGSSSFFRELAVAQLWTVNSIAVLREVLVRSERVLRQTQGELTDAQARALRAEGALEAARTARSEELDEANRRAATELARARETQDRLDTAIATVNARDLRIDAYTFEVKAATMRATQAEDAARRNEEALRLAEARATQAEEAARQAEAVPRATEAWRAAILADFRKSQDFEDELAEASAGAYELGFHEAKEKISRTLGLTGLDDIEPDVEPEAPDEEPEAPAGEQRPDEDAPVPTEDRPVTPRAEPTGEGSGPDMA